MSGQILRTPLISPVKIPGGGLKAVATGAALLILLFLFAISVGGGFAWGLFIGSILGSPACLWILYRKFFAANFSATMSKVASEGRAAFTRLIGKAPDYMDVEALRVAPFDRIAPTGIAWDGACIYIMENGEAARIPWSAIRNWTWEIHGHSETQVFGNTDLVTTVQVTANNGQAFWEAYAQSGFLVSVMDVEKPTWRFTTTNESVLRKWQEIFQQISEGRMRIESAA